MPTPLLELVDITKCFPGVLALDGVSLAVSQGEVVALIGENGAGKSTLMKVLGGVYQADAGQIRFAGKPVSIRQVADAIGLGIGFIHQELNVLDNLDVAANVFLGREPRWGGPLRLVDRRRAARECEPHLRRLGLDPAVVGPQTLVRDLSLAQQQLVEIAKALSQNARVLIMDEPTSSLTLTETARLLATVRELRGQGVSVIYISHRLGEVEQVADRVVVLRDGRNAGTLEHDQISHEAMVTRMVGRALEEGAMRRGDFQSPCSFEVLGVRTPYRPGHAVSFTVARGEILGLAGLVGAGRSELAQTLFGVERPLAGSVRLDGRTLAIGSPRDAIAAGIYLAPEDRRRTGLVLEMSVRENITMAGLERVAAGCLIRPGREAEMAAHQAQALPIKAPSLEATVGTLSGGNQQKVVLAKWLALDPRVILLDEPTRGIDVGAKAEIYRLMRDLADRGVAIVMISSDMEEVLGVSDRIAVMHEGAITGFLERAQFSEEAILRLAVGRSAA